MNETELLVIILYPKNNFNNNYQKNEFIKPKINISIIRK